MSDLYLNEECYYFEENTCDNEVFAPPFFNHFSLSLSIKKRVVITILISNKSAAKPIHTSAADLLLIRIGSFG